MKRTHRVLSVSETPVTAEGISASHVGEEAVVVLNLGNGVYYGLDGVGCRVWELIQKSTAIVEIGKKLVEEYDVKPARAATDLLRLLQQMEAAGVVELGDKALGRALLGGRTLTTD